MNIHYRVRHGGGYGYGAVDLLVTGKTDQETAEAVGVTRQTVNGWRNANPWFVAALNAR